MEDGSKADVSGLSVQSDESRDEDDAITYSDGAVSRNEALVFLLFIVLLAIAVVWKINIMIIVIGMSPFLFFLKIFSYLPKSAVYKARHSRFYELKARCTKVENMSTEKMNSRPAGPPILLLPVKETSRNKTWMLRKCELGTRNMYKEEKVIMVVGATGAGKTTLINGMVNYILGVEWEDNFRFKMILDEDEKELRTQVVNQTQWITAYTLHHESHFKIPFTLTIIDTPGFDDTRGIEHDNKTITQISEFLHTKGAGEIDHITAIGIVVPSSTARLTHAQKFIFDAVLSLFGKNVEQNIFLMITFSDGQIPPVLDAITKAGIPHRKYFKFNNSALFAKSSVNNEDIDNDTGFDRMFWEIGSKSFDKFFVQIQKMKNKSLQLTKNVLDERMSLETSVQEIRLQLTAWLNKLEQYNTEVTVVKKHKKRH